MKLFFVRHGQSVDHSEDRHQSPDSPLSGEGKKQAEFAAKKIVNHEIDHILTSHLSRANQTAEIISKHSEINYEIIFGLHELVRPSNLVGSKHNSDISKSFVNEWIKNKYDLDWKYKGKGESMRELFNRVDKVINHILSKHQDQNLLIVAHGYVIGALFCLLVLGKFTNDDALGKLWFSLQFDNTGISLLEYDSIVDKWKIKFMNDHSHIL